MGRSEYWPANAAGFEQASRHAARRILRERRHGPAFVPALAATLVEVIAAVIAEVRADRASASATSSPA